MTEFEDNLWDVVVQRHGDDLARLDPAPGPPGRRRHLGWLAAAGAAVAAVATTLSVLLAGLSGSPAYAVDRLDSGAVLVKINAKIDLPDANAKLLSLGLGEVVVIDMAHGRAPTPGPVTCRRQAGLKGPPLQVLIGDHGTEKVSSVTYHLHDCVAIRPVPPSASPSR